MRTVLHPLIITALCLILVGCGGSGGDGGASPTPVSNGITTLTARAFAEGAAGNDTVARIQVAWTKPADIPSENLVEYHIFRDGQIIGVAVPDRTQFIDSPTLPYSTLSYQTIQSAGGSAVNTLVTATQPVATLTVGTQHEYSVTALYQRITSAGSKLYTETERTAHSRATPLARPAITHPNSPQDTRSVAVYFFTVAGADSYVFEFSSTPDFQNKAVLGPFNFAYLAGPSSSGFLNINASFPDSVVPANGTIYYRVGAFSSADTTLPLGTGTPNGDARIYSAIPGSFTKLGTPPSPP